MSIQLLISGAILGLLLARLCYRIMQGWQSRAVRRRDIDRLIEQFHELCRQIAQEKYQRP